jgi:hypothetical protein
MKHIKLGFSATLLLMTGILFSNCSKPEVSFKSTGFTYPEDFLRNPAVMNTLSLAEPKFTLYGGPNPPAIEGEYSTTQCYYSSKSSNPNIEYQIGQNLNTIFLFYNQTTNGTILFSEKEDNTFSFSSFSTGAHSFITGQGNNFTVYSEILNPDGSTTVSITSGQMLSSGDLQIQNVTVGTANPPTGINVGDWFSFAGLLVH